MITTALWVAVALIAIALIFDFTNGFHDAANATSTAIASRSLTPYKAVILATVFNFLPAFVVGTSMMIVMMLIMIVINKERRTMPMISVMLPSPGPSESRSPRRRLKLPSAMQPGR